VTLIGQDAEEATVQGVIAPAEAVAARITQTGARPEGNSPVIPGKEISRRWLTANKSHL